LALLGHTAILKLLTGTTAHRIFVTGSAQARGQVVAGVHGTIFQIATAIVSVTTASVIAAIRIRIDRLPILGALDRCTTILLQEHSACSTRGITSILEGLRTVAATDRSFDLTTLGAHTEFVGARIDHANGPRRAWFVCIAHTRIVATIRIGIDGRTAIGALVRFAADFGFLR